MSEPAAAVRRVVVEADGGSRGNPGPAAYGAVLRDADSGRVLAEAAGSIGRATNNVAEYRGLIAGLELAAEQAPGSAVEVRMDSRLVVEQMAGRWRIKHVDLRPLALQAQRLAPAGTEWVWIPREQNAAADRLLNSVLDGTRAAGVQLGEVDRVAGVAGIDEVGHAADSAAAEPAERDERPGSGARGDPQVGWREREKTTPTTIVLLRHGVTEHTLARLFCGSGGSDPGLTAEGRAQVERAARWLQRRGGQPYQPTAGSTAAGPIGLDGVGPVDVVVTSPLRRCRETAQIAADLLALPVDVVDDLAEAAFGEWDGLTYTEVQQRWPELLEAWLRDETLSPPAGESMAAAATRATRALAKLVAEHRGRTVLTVSHLTPIKAIVRETLDTSVQVMHRMQLAPASLTVVQWWPDGAAVLRTFSYEPE